MPLQNEGDACVKEGVARVCRFMETLPPFLRCLGRSYLERGYPFQTAFLNNELAFPGLHLPFWIAQSCLARRQAGPDLNPVAFQSVEAALFGYLYIRIQDDLYDFKEGEDPAHLLLANEFIAECFRLYQEIFGAREIFWELFRKYWREFSEATAWEIQSCRKGSKGMEGEDLRQVGQKLSFAKIPVAAVALKGGAEKELPLLLEIVDRLATSSQLLNDFWSLRHDLQTGHYTYPLSQALRGSEPRGEADPSQLQSALFQGLLKSEAVESLFSHVIKRDEEVLALLAGFSAPPLASFLRNRIEKVGGMRQKYLTLKLESLLTVS